MLRHHTEAMAHSLNALQAGLAAPSRQLVTRKPPTIAACTAGKRYMTAACITPEVTRAVESLAELAPLHKPASPGGIQEVEQGLPWGPQVVFWT